MYQPMTHQLQIQEGMIELEQEEQVGEWMSVMMRYVGSMRGSNVPNDGSDRANAGGPSHSSTWQKVGHDVSKRE
jgi:hypothetical protein